ncbi:MAG: divergent polysaccharide deacetylase family protein [Thermoanaerobaculia bacterium]
MTRRKPPKGGRSAAPSSRSKSSRRRKGSLGRMLGILLAAAVLFGLGAYFGERLLRKLPALPDLAHRIDKTAPPAKPKLAAKSEPKSPAIARTAPPTPEKKTPLASPPPTGSGASAVATAARGESASTPREGQPKARIAIVIDDLGRDVESVEALTRIGANGTIPSQRTGAIQLSYAVLPYESHTADVLEALRRHGAEVLLHLPMDPEGRADPGPGALTARMSKRELAEATEAALAAVPGAVGVNNHMGSKITAERSAMEAILAVIQRHGLYFLDSRTTADSVGFEVAREKNIAAAARDFFLDDELGRSEIAAQFARLLARAREQGAAIAIAHPHPSTLAVLAEEIPRAAAAGFEFVPLSYLVERGEGLTE